ncbi:MAG TPA: hypothetical protein VNA19_12755 [Pyrinomonadaceae bacterium]|nr:hypothetical protein [Pyrinomonadaceae bacterium]
MTTALAVSAACTTTTTVERSDGEARGLVIVNAPATGEIRRVLVREGMSVGEGTPVVEIAVPVEGSPPGTPAAQEDPQARARVRIQAAQGEIEAARAEVVRTEVEVQRLTALVSTGGATQAQLDGARAEYERAQQRFQRAQGASQNAQSGLVAARQQPPPPPANPARAAAPSEQLVMALTTSAGTVSAINARVGQRVTAGQPLATLRAGER